MNTIIFVGLALAFFIIVSVVVWWMKNLADKLKNRQGQILPVFFRFRQEVFPALLTYWVLIVILFLVFGWDWLWVIGVWASVTTIMLWSCARSFGRTYLSYRRPLFILGVLSMAALPALGFALDWLPKGDINRTWALLVVVGILTIFSIIAGLKGAIARPTQMLFRPDLLFGDGRVLATGIIAIGLSMRFLFGGAFPIPKGNWYGLLFAIVFGIIQIIPLRGMFKLRLRMERMIENRLGGWGWVFIREAWFLAAVLGLLYGFHNVLMGRVPIVDNTLGGLDPGNFATMGQPGLILMAIAAAFFIFIRGGYKKLACGDPFIRETLNQSVIKSILFLVGLLPFLYGFAHVMEGHGGAFPRPFPTGLSLTVGLSLLIWGILMESVFRIWVQQVQQRAIAEQMVAVVLPRLENAKRKELMVDLMEAVSEIEEGRRRAFIKSMLSGLEHAPEDSRKIISDTRLQVLAELPEHQRKTIMKSMDAVMLKMT